MVETIKLVRLRGTLKFYEHLKHYLKFLNDFGYDSIKGTNTNWKAFKLRLVGLGVDGWDLGDIKSVLRKLDIIKDSQLTTFGQDLFTHKEDEDYLKKGLANLMLIGKKGWAYCEILRKNPYGSRENIGALYSEVYDRGSFQDEYQDISKYNIFLNWLGVSKEIGGKYKLEEIKYNEYMGIITNDIELLDKNLKLSEKYCLFALIKLTSLEERPYTVKEIRDFVRQEYNFHIDTHKQNSYGNKLVEMEFIEYTYSSEDNTNTHQRGQVGMWKLIDSNRLNEIILKILQDTIKFNINWSLIEVVKTSFESISEKINSSDDHIKGVGLEQFASKICWILGLKDIKLNYVERGLELDVVAIQEYPFFTRFLIQCKNTNSTTSPAILYKEVGVASTKKFDNIMIFSTSGFSSNMRDVSEKVMEKTGINIYLFDKEDVDQIIATPNSLMKIMERENIRIKEIRHKN